MLPPWPPIDRVALPREGEALVIAVPLRLPPARLSALRALLSADELAKADRFAFPDLRVRSAAARGQLREIVGSALHAPPAALQFDYGPQGKPSLSGAKLHFNVSHSGDVGLVSLAQVEHGVDFELHRRLRQEEVGQRFFAPDEVRCLAAAPIEERVRVFFETWTAKEAFLKATGEGITVPLADFETRWTAPGAGHIEVLRGSARGRSFWVRALDVGAGASAAVVAEGEPLHIGTATWGR